jgi:hypothetical protein
MTRRCRPYLRLVGNEDARLVSGVLQRASLCLVWEQIMDVRTRKLYKTLKGVHTNICTSVLFQAHRPWELVSGGLDAQMVRWDFGSGRHRNIWQMGMPVDGCSHPCLCRNICHFDS